MTMMAPSHIQSIIKVTSFLFESDAPFLQIVFIFLVNFIDKAIVMVVENA